MPRYSILACHFIVLCFTSSIEGLFLFYNYHLYYDQLRNTMTGGIGLSTFFSKENFEQMFPKDRYNYDPNKQQSLPRNSYTFKSDTKTGKKRRFNPKTLNKKDDSKQRLNILYNFAKAMEGHLKSNKIPFEIKKINIVKEGMYLVKILEYENRAASNHLIKKKIFVDEKLIINKLKELENLVGFNIIEKNNKIGTVKDYYNQEQPILFC